MQGEIYTRWDMQGEIYASHLFAWNLWVNGCGGLEDNRIKHVYNHENCFHFEIHTQQL